MEQKDLETPDNTDFEKYGFDPEEKIVHVVKGSRSAVAKTLLLIESHTADVLRRIGVTPVEEDIGRYLDKEWGFETGSSGDFVRYKYVANDLDLEAIRDAVADRSEVRQNETLEAAISAMLLPTLWVEYFCDKPGWGFAAALATLSTNLPDSSKEKLWESHRQSELGTRQYRKSREFVIKHAPVIFKEHPEIRMGELVEQLQSELIKERLPAPQRAAISGWINEAGDNAQLTLPKTLSRPGRPKES